MPGPEHLATDVPKLVMEMGCKGPQGVTRSVPALSQNRVYLDLCLACF